MDGVTQDDGLPLEDPLGFLRAALEEVAVGLGAQKVQRQLGFLRPPPDRHGETESDIRRFEVEQVGACASELSRAFDVELDPDWPVIVVGSVTHDPDLASYGAVPRPAVVVVGEELEPCTGFFGAGQIGMIDQAIGKQLQSPDLRIGRVPGIGIEAGTIKQDRFPGECASTNELAGCPP